MALQAQQLPSFSFASPTLWTLRLSCPLKSFSKCFLRSHSHFQTPRRRNHPLAYPPLRFSDQHGTEDDDDWEQAEGSWGPPARAHLYGAREDRDDDGGGWGPRHGEAAEEKELQESKGEDEDGGEVGEWDPPFSPFRGQREDRYDQEEDDDDENGGGCEWLDPCFFLRSQEGVSDVCSTTTAAMEEILAFARNPAVDGPGFAEFLAGYTGGAFSEGECVELMRRMGEEGLALGCVHLFRWMREQGTLLVPVSPQAWLVAIVALGRMGMADEILEIVAGLPPERQFREAVLYNSAISAVAYRGRYDIAWEIFELMEKNNVQPDHRTSSVMLNVMKKSKASAKDAWEFFQRMNRKGVNWSLDAAAALINIFCCGGLKKEALIIQSEMEKRGIASNISIYNTLMKAYCKSNQIEETEWLFVEMKEKGLQATTSTYNILMDAYGRRLQPEVVELLLLEMQDLRLRPSARSYNCLINAYGRQKKMSEKAEDAFLRMKTDGIKPLSSSYTALLCAYAVNGLNEKAHNIYMDMKREGHKPTLETYTALLDTLRRAGDTEKLMETWKSMIDEKVGGTMITFHMVLDCLAKHGLYLQARDVIYEFGKMGLKPTVMTYNILMNAYGRGGQHYKMPQLLKEMIVLELKPDSITYGTMIYAYARVRDFSRAFYYHKQMVRSGQVPDSRSYRKLLNTLDVKAARKNIKDKSAIQGIIKSKSGLKTRKEKKDEFWKNRKKGSMLNPAYGRQRKRFL
ncbi:pentatricopeptide repeat-containing protein At5g50280, chloroplastic-like [Phragmites australis]|uniref:pentatricopeptide repeat-containing protein At5g50280, chloroplastic-like n=1 Tax=Phragmites australis TaxID=29695 RepID=UPI002D7719E1|nr:pentatricopeptide repeat-containing protein At5g50280, chloroplastic-like [Phragmites australis]